MKRNVSKSQDNSLCDTARSSISSLATLLGHFDCMGSVQLFILVKNILPHEGDGGPKGCHKTLLKV
jgi:hypothetical protein